MFYMYNKIFIVKLILNKTMIVIHVNTELPCSNIEGRQENMHKKR